MTDQVLEPRWLDERELDTWMRFLAVSFLLPAALEQRMQRQNGMSMFEYLVLAMLSEAPDRTQQLKALAKVVNGSLSRLSHVLKRLEARDWVRRSPKPGDGRVTVATLTDAGYATLAAAAPSHVEDVRSLVFDQLSSGQVDQLRAICERLVVPLTEDVDCG